MTLSISAPARFAGNDEIRLIRDAYIGRSLPPARYEHLDECLARRIALAYDAMPVIPPTRQMLEDAGLAYSALVREVEDQFEAIVESSFRIAFVANDPYQSSAVMMADLRDHRRLRVLKTSPGQRHPFMTADQNDRFRAVHDFFGHAMEGFQFGPRGEDNAWREHGRMFASAAIPALTTETRGQNCWVNFACGHEFITSSLRPFATQKFGLLPAFAYEAESQAGKVV